MAEVSFATREVRGATFSVARTRLLADYLAFNRWK